MSNFDLIKGVEALNELYEEIEWEIEDELIEEFGEDFEDLSEEDWASISEVVDTLDVTSDDIDWDSLTLSEAAKRAFKRTGKVIKRWYRCSAGPKAGKLVSDPTLCSKRKDPKKVRQGRKVAKQKKGVRIAKSRVAKRQAVSKMVTKMNKRLSGK